MHCPNCRKEIEERSKFCRYCGANVEESQIEARQKRVQEVKDIVSCYDTPKIMPKDVLEEGEMIAFETRPQKVCHLLGWWILGIIFFLSGVGAFFASYIAGVIILIIAFLMLGIPYLRWWFTVYCLTTGRVMKLKGIVSKEVYENRLEKVQDLRLKVGIIQRMFDCGDIFITTAGTAGVECAWHNIPNARQAQKILRALLGR